METAAIPAPPDIQSAMLRCVDGSLSIHDIARAARVSVKQVRRAIDARVANDDAREFADEYSSGAIMSIGAEDVVDADNMTRAQMARVVASRLGLNARQVEQRTGARPGTIGSLYSPGKSVPIKKLAQVAAATGMRPEDIRPDLSPLEIQMATSHPRGHLYRDGVKGRSLHSEQKPGEGHVLHAIMKCQRVGCSAQHRIRLRNLPGPEIVDHKFEQAGWGTDPVKCPTCKAPKQEKIMSAATPTSNAIRAQAKVFNLLGLHFDADTGTFAQGWSDAKIASDSGMTLDLVRQYRVEAFGELKEPPEIAALARDIEALTGMIDEAVAPLKSELAQMKVRLADIRKRFTA